MPRYFFHLSAPDQLFRDPIGSDIDDLATVHSRAVRLSERVIAYPLFVDCPAEFRRWTVKVTDEAERPVIEVIFPAHSAPRSHNEVCSKDARTLFFELEGALKVDAAVPCRSQPTAWKLPQHLPESHEVLEQRERDKFERSLPEEIRKVDQAEQDIIDNDRG